MTKLHYCKNGVNVTEQVIKFQESGKHSDFKYVKEYYDNYRDFWYQQVSEHIDRDTFDAEYNFKLTKAVQTFKASTAAGIAKKKGYTSVAAFNGWFYQILSNWRSNVKNSSFRIKTRPSVQCPICGRQVPRITEEHLQHIKSPKNLPKFFTYEGTIYQLELTPKIEAVSWGPYSRAKMTALKRGGSRKEYVHEKNKCDWPWRLPNGNKGVFCPLTKKIVEVINDDYIASLSSKLNRYAEPYSYSRFAEEYSNSLTQSEVFTLDYNANFEEEGSFKDYVKQDCRNPTPATSTEMTYDKVCSGNVPPEYEFVFQAIDNLVENEDDRMILKLVTIGYSSDDIADSLGMDKREVRKRMNAAKSNKNLEEKLVE